MANEHTKVGSDPKAAHEFGGKGDFGIPARENVAKAHDGQIEGRPAGSAPGNTGARGVRTSGVGSLGGESGHDSGGDLDPDYIGLDGRGGLSAKPVKGHSDGPDDAEQMPQSVHGRDAGKHGTAPNAQGDYVDHSGEDRSTVNPDAAGSVKSNREDPGAEGEITMDEATGSVGNGAET